MELPKRKANRLTDYDYSQNGVYFITICIKERKPILSKVEMKNSSVGNDVLGVPIVKLTKYGKITEKIILQVGQFYDGVKIDNYVIMPNHIHLLISINNNGASRTPHPTISSIIGIMKKFINKEIGYNIWQKSFYDHIIRNDEDYNKIYNYIDENPIKWEEDKYYEE